MRREALLALAARLAAPYRMQPPERFGGGWAGSFKGQLDGQSVDFHDFRGYQPGDDLRRVDWKAYARSGMLHLKLFQEEISPVVEVVLDTSASMGAYTGKTEAALFVAAFLRTVTLASEGRPVLCRDGRRFAGEDWETAIAATTFTGDPTAFAAGTGAGRPVRWLISDFLFSDGLRRLFRRLSAGSLSFRPVMILSRSELAPPWRGPLRLQDVEDAQLVTDRTIGAEEVSAYRARLHAHVEAVAGEARRTGGGLVRIDVPDGGLGAGDCQAIVELLVKEGAVRLR